MKTNSTKGNKFSLLRNLLKCTFAFVLLVCLTGCPGYDDYDIFAKIHGTVTDYHTGTPLPNASITLSPSGFTTLTDANGYYAFEKLDAMQYTITAQKSGYQPNRKTITAVSGETMQINIQLTVIPQ